MKKITNFLVVSLLLYCCFCIFMNSKEVTSSIILSFDVWKNNIFPSLFPMFVITNILINYNFINILSKLFSFLQKIFKIGKGSIFILFMSLLSGFPSSAKYTSELVNQNIVSKEEASKILVFSHFSNPLFIINTIGISFLNNFKIGIYILIIHYFSNIIIGLIFRNYKISKVNNFVKEYKHESFGKILSISIINSVNTLIIILGTVSFFLIITTIINQTFNMTDITKTIINGLFEMTQGLKYVSLLDISLRMKTVLSIIFISFGGLSVHIQIYSLISENNIKYLPFLIGRILHGLIGGLLGYLLFYLI